MMTRSHLLLFGGGVLLVIGAGAGWWWYQTGTPEYSLLQLARALRTHDRLAVEDYVDAHRVAESVVDNALQSVTTNAMQQSSGGWQTFGTMLGTGLAQQLRPALVGSLERGIATAADSPSTATT